MSILKSEKMQKTTTVTFETNGDLHAVILSGLISRGIIEDDGVCDQDSHTSLVLLHDGFDNIVGVEITTIDNLF